jgi:hypothetical protein
LGVEKSSTLTGHVSWLPVTGKTYILDYGPKFFFRDAVITYEY